MSKCIKIARNHKFAKSTTKMVYYNYSLVKILQKVDQVHLNHQSVIIIIIIVKSFNST